MNTPPQTPPASYHHAITTSDGGCTYNLALSEYQRDENKLRNTLTTQAFLKPLHRVTFEALCPGQLGPVASALKDAPTVQELHVTMHTKAFDWNPEFQHLADNFHLSNVLHLSLWDFFNWTAEDNASLKKILDTGLLKTVELFGFSAQSKEVARETAYLLASQPSLQKMKFVAMNHDYTPKCHMLDFAEGLERGFRQRFEQIEVNRQSYNLSAIEFDSCDITLDALCRICDGIRDGLVTLDDLGFEDCTLRSDSLRYLAKLLDLGMVSKSLRVESAKLARGDDVARLLRSVSSSGLRSLSLKHCVVPHEFGSLLEDHLVPNSSWLEALDLDFVVLPDLRPFGDVSHIIALFRNHDRISDLRVLQLSRRKDSLIMHQEDEEEEEEVVPAPAENYDNDSSCSKSSDDDEDEDDYSLRDDVLERDYRESEKIELARVALSEESKLQRVYETGRKPPTRGWYYGHIHGVLKEALELNTRIQRAKKRQRSGEEVEMDEEDMQEEAELDEMLRKRRKLKKRFESLF